MELVGQDGGTLAPNPMENEDDENRRAADAVEFGDAFTEIFHGALNRKRYHPMSRRPMVLLRSISKRSGLVPSAQVAAAHSVSVLGGEFQRIATRHASCFDVGHNLSKRPVQTGASHHQLSGLGTTARYRRATVVRPEPVGELYPAIDRCSEKGAQPLSGSFPAIAYP
jgi:hypothetical protein